MQKQLNAETAIVTTAAIDVRCLTINGKQLTLSVFRQIPFRQIVDMTNLRLNGLPWGIVNYFWGEHSEETKGGIHVVWQEGNKLFRSLNKTVKEIKPTWSESFMRDPIRRVSVWDNTLHLSVEHFALNSSGYYGDTLSSDRILQCMKYFDDVVCEDIEFSNRFEKAILFVKTKIEEQNREHIEYCKNWNLLVRPLYNLEQLFIAV